MKICFLTKIEKPGAEKAIAFSKQYAQHLDVFHGSSTDSFPEKPEQESYDLLISYMSPWIVPQLVLDKTKGWNINFHPGPPEYPGTGCFNFALYDSATEYGCTAHLMDKKVDTGQILAVKRFRIGGDITVESLANKTYHSVFALYKELLPFIVESGRLPVCEETWTRKPFTRKELEDLATIVVGVSEEEISRRIRSTYYPNKPAPFVEIFGYRFEYNPKR